MTREELIRIENKTMDTLKDFQRATVERLHDLYLPDKHKRVLVADEVGMGKTLIARGAIVKMAKIRYDEGDDLFKVVYICSNSGIANQNISKLKVSDSAIIEGVSDTRLSMQHLKISEQENDEDLRDGFIQLIPLTPDTSFRMTSGGGNVLERALMYAILKRIPGLSAYNNRLEKFMIYGAEKAWKSWVKDNYENRVKNCERYSNGKYPANVISKIYEYNKESHIIEDLIDALEGKSDGQQYYLMVRLRTMFARISVEMMEPDFVIMDEFQRFKFLLTAEDNSDVGILAKKFLGNDETRVLLLSATPYKLYSTLEEIDSNNNVDEHYTEFLQVMDFLFEDKNDEFHEIWRDYNVALHEMKEGTLSVIKIKESAENAMYRGTCRTERISVMDSGDYIDDSDVDTPLEINENDIRSYLAMDKLLKDIDANFSLPLDYVKSCPNLMSFMRNYKVKEYIEKYFDKHPEDIELARNNMLWIDNRKVGKYDALPANNARLEKLKEIVFANRSEMLLWVPPSKPYYELQGAFKNKEDFSKVIVFSAWEMVPRMIGAMISYEAERLTVGRVQRQADKISYSSKSRYPSERLVFALNKDGEPGRMNMFALLYPSKYLSGLYNPIDAINNGLKLSDIEREIREKVKKSLNFLSTYQDPNENREDQTWYYMAPMLLDDRSEVKDWIENTKKHLTDGENEEGDKKKRGSKAFAAHMDKLMDYIHKGPTLRLGKMPSDLVNTLVNMALGSPVVCIYRANGGNAEYATSLARVFMNYFNTVESTATVELAASTYHTRTTDDNTHWQDVLVYCKDGCFQAMFDEYLHLIKDSVGFSSESVKAQRIHDIMKNDLSTHTATYRVDTYSSFRKKCVSDDDSENSSLNMRANFAVGFMKGEGGDSEKTNMRRDSIRGAFNSPLKPFVLATTSIGQEGLDFHNYCRKIMHWNLPSNPIDLEQREGRINRFKCLAIRQNVATDEEYNDLKFNKDIWKELFNAAISKKKEGQSDLVPYWCYGKDQKVKIERFVPMYPMSKDGINYERLIKILSLYRLTLGQARQEELLEYLYKECKNPEELKELFINLSPFSKEGKA